MITVINRRDMMGNQILINKVPLSHFDKLTWEVHVHIYMLYWR